MSNSILSFNPSWNFVPESQRAPWPPLGFRRIHEVSKGKQDWLSVASANGIPDPKDLIYFNFRTLNPRRINWYLHNYVGCYQSEDGKNFMFEGANPGVIYIPPALWTRRNQIEPFNIQLVQKIYEVSRFYPSIVYRKKGYYVTRADLIVLIQNIRSNKVQVLRDDSLLPKGERAHYARERDERFHYGELVLRENFSFSKSYDMTTLIHECTHGILHNKGYWAIELDHELLARAASGVFLYHYNNIAFGGLTPNAQRDLSLYLANAPGHVKIIDDFDVMLPYEPRSWIGHPSPKWRNPVQDLIKWIKEHYPMWRY